MSTQEGAILTIALYGSSGSIGGPPLALARLRAFFGNMAVDPLERPLGADSRLMSKPATSDGYVAALPLGP